MKSLYKIFFIAFVTLLTACDTQTGGEQVNIDREAFLINMADNLIQPSIEDFKAKADALSSASGVFGENVTAENLNTLRVAVKDSWLSYQHLAFLQVGPVSTINLRDRVNIFPTDPTTIEANIESMDYNLGSAANVDAKGFPALDYLLFGTGLNDDEIIAYFTDPTSGQASIQYLQDLVNEIQTVATQMDDEWENYRPIFIDNLGTDVGSGTSLLVIEFNFQFDIRIKNAKIGFPSGGNPRTGGILSPENVEAYYSGWSGELAEAAVQASLDVFKGISYSTGVDGLGLDDYVEALNAETRDGSSLALAIEENINIAYQEMQSISSPYSEVASQENSQLVDVYNALQEVIPLIKVDMTSAMSVSITFQDNDGD